MDDVFANPALLALIATVFGGAGLKVVEHWLNKTKTTTDGATELRNELRTDIARLREDLSVSKKESELIEHELDEWKVKYYDLMRDFIQIRAELDTCLKILKDRAEVTDKQLREITKEVTEG